MGKIVSISHYKKAKKVEQLKERFRAFSDIVFTAEFLIPSAIFVGLLFFFISLDTISKFIF